MAEIRPNIRVDKEIRFGRTRIPNSIIRLRLSRSRKSMSKFGFGFLSFKPSFLCSSLRQQCHHQKGTYIAVF